MRMRFKLPAYRLFVEPFVQAQFEGNIKDPRHWPLWRESTGHRWIPFTEASDVELWCSQIQIQKKFIAAQENTYHKHYEHRLIFGT